MNGLITRLWLILSLSGIASPAFAGAASQAQADALLPFTASYSAEFDQGISLQGEAKRHLKQLDNGDWRLTMEASALIASINESSRINFDNALFRPLAYDYQRKVMGKKRQQQLRFDHQQRQISNPGNTTTWPMPENANVHDKLSYQLQLWSDIIAGEQQVSYTVADGDRFREYRFQVIGEEHLKTAAGEFDTIVVERQRGEDRDRETTIWFSREYAQLIVKLEQREGRKTYKILLDRYNAPSSPDS